jgi:hypothetical protein
MAYFANPGEEQKFVAAPDRQLYPYAITNDGKILVVVDTTNAAAKGDISMISMEGEDIRMSNTEPHLASFCRKTQD